MAGRKRSIYRDKRLRDEIADEFRQAQLDTEPALLPPPEGRRRRKYQPERLPTRIRDGQYVELPNELSSELLPEPAVLPTDTHFAAQRLLEALVYVATGKGLIQRVIPVRSNPAKGSKYVHAGATDGVRHLVDSDHRRIRRAFTAVIGVPPERYWELVLELALRDALVSRHVLPEGQAIYTQRGVQVATTPDRPTGATILALVRARALAGTVPDYLTADMIDIGLQKCTDGRGGGRGAGKRLSVRRWIKELKKKAEAARKGTRRPTPL